MIIFVNFNRAIAKLIKAKCSCVYDPSPLSDFIIQSIMLIFKTLVKDAKGQGESKNAIIFQVQSNLILITKEFFKIVNSMDIL